MKGYGFGGERRAAYREEIERKLQELTDFIKSAALDSRKQYGAPVTDDGRIDVYAYRTVYSDEEVRKDARETSEGLREWTSGIVSDRTVFSRDQIRDNERLEMLVYAIFYKNLRDLFVVVRASRHDGSVNHVHTVLLDKGTGNVVCAFDEVRDVSGSDYQVTQREIKNLNTERGGVKLKYGLGSKKEGGRLTVVPAEAKNIPLFYIALPKDNLEAGIRGFNPALETPSDIEKRLFAYFISSIEAQIKGLEVLPEQLNEDFKKCLSTFHRLIENLKSSI